MKNIAILGGSKFIGLNLLLSLHKRGHKITLYNRNITIPSIKYPDDIILIVGDRNNSSDYKKLFIKYYDVVYDLSGYNLTQVNPILMFYKKYIGHYIFCSTTSVYKYTNNPPYNEECAKVFNPNTYGGDKSLVEDVLLGHCVKYNWPVTIFRPQGVFGKYDPWQAGYIYYRLIQNLPIYIFPEYKYRINPLYIDDFVSALILAIDIKKSHGSVYNVAGDDVVNNLEFVELCSVLSSFKLKLRYIKTPNSHARYDTGKSWLTHDIVADSTKIKSQLGVQYTALEHALKKTYDWLSANQSNYN